MQYHTLCLQENQIGAARLNQITMSAETAPPRETDPAARLSEWAGARAEEYQVIAQKRDADSSMADRALEIVRQFIVERGLILYGGQAIDFALRLKGSRIYPDHQRPDYDAFSTQSVDDAYELADRLVSAGFPHVGAIPAIHIQTMRVSTDFIYVADISYVPREVFARLPTVSYGGMRVLHPDYQRLDMHLTLCFPFNGPPREDIFHRYRKVLERFRLLERLYPIGAGGLNAAVGGAAGAARPAEVELDFTRTALHGFAAYAAIRNAYGELLATVRGADAAADLGPALELDAVARGGRALVRFTPPVAAPRLTIATPWPEEVVPALAEALKGTAVWYAPYMDVRPPMARITGSAEVDVFSTRHRLLTVVHVRVAGVRVTIATPQYVLLFFLYEAQAASDPALRNLYMAFYTATLDLLEAGGELIASLRDGGGADQYRALVECSPFGLPVETIGDSSRDAAYFIRLANSALKVKDTPPGVDPADLPSLALPARYYPGGRHTPGQHPPFDYNSNPAFQRTGQPI